MTWRTPEAERPAGAIVWPADSFDRACALAAYEDPAVREEWRAAYEGEPPARYGAALLKLAAWLDGIPPRPHERTGGARVLA